MIEARVVAISSLTSQDGYSVSIYTFQDRFIGGFYVLGNHGDVEYELIGFQCVAKLGSSPIYEVRLIDNAQSQVSRVSSTWDDVSNGSGNPRVARPPPN
ncbi:MAG: hypothetical protein HC927_05975 [Deltaproteobacteria bacterium]|nr:hypothetical protein [Deltaproteobacteria bacterium]